MRVQICMKKLIVMPDSELDYELIESWSNKAVRAKGVVGKDIPMKDGSGNKDAGTISKLANTYIEIEFG